MSKRQFKAQASSSRATFGTASGSFGHFGSALSGSTLSYLSEPPNLSTIQDANVVVAFKNLLKKDSTTKTKGLEDLRLFVGTSSGEKDGGVGEPVVEAWVKLFPQISIDNSRRVRELSHVLQYELLKNTRRRMEKYIPRIVGPWLAGIYDRDRPVSRAANDGITSFLDTDVKLRAFWRKCQTQILSYAQEAISETPQTLSDERTSNPDDAEAKYDRVVSGSIALVSNLLDKLNKEDIEQQRNAYRSFLSDNGSVWRFATSKDALTRRTVCRLVEVSLSKELSLLEDDQEMLSKFFVSEGLRSQQSGSSVQFLQALNSLSLQFPEIWTKYCTGKKTPGARLGQFIEKGAQMGPVEFWASWSSLQKLLPEDMLVKDREFVLGLLASQRKGMSSRGEVRANTSAAWSSYLDLVELYDTSSKDSASEESIVSAAIYPMFAQYLRPHIETSQWSVNDNVSLLVRAFDLCLMPNISDNFGAEWKRLEDLLITDVRASLPQQAKDFDISQAHIATQAERWFKLQTEILRQNPCCDTLSFLRKSLDTLIPDILETLVSRRGKPYGAAVFVDVAVQRVPEILEHSPTAQSSLKRFFQDDFSSLVTSPSASHLIAALINCGALPFLQPMYESIWETTIDGLMAAPSSTEISKAVQSLLSHQSARDMAKRSASLQQYLCSEAFQGLQGEESALKILHAALRNDCFDVKACEHIKSDILRLLGEVPMENERIFGILDTICQCRADWLADDSFNLAVTTRLLAIEHASAGSAQSRVQAIQTAMSTARSKAGITGTSRSTIVQLVQESLTNAGPQSLSLDVLVRQVQDALQGDDAPEAASILPETDLWQSAIVTLLQRQPPSALALVTSLRGAVFLTSASPQTLSVKPERDADGYSIALRMAVYCTKILDDHPLFSDLPTQKQASILRLLKLTQLLANDQLSLREDNVLWSSLPTEEDEAKVQDYLIRTHHILMVAVKAEPKWRQKQSAQSSIGQLITILIEESRGSSPVALYSARALCDIFTDLHESHGWELSGGDEWLDSLAVMKASTPDIFLAMAVLTGFKDALGSSKIVGNLCNRLISDVAGATAQSERTLGLLVLLNSTLSVYDDIDIPVAQNRLIFAVKQITSWMEEASLPVPNMSVGMISALQKIFPAIAALYGDHWSIALDFCTSAMLDNVEKRRLDFQLPLVHGCLELVELCRKLYNESSMDDVNDDLGDALEQWNRNSLKTLLCLLQIQRSKENQPLLIVDDVLYREVRITPIKELDVSCLYPLVASRFRLVQSSAFDILHRHAIISGEAISYEAILDKKDLHLPEELLSLLLDAPISENFSDDSLSQYPSPIRTYLLSWQLIFDLYDCASNKVRNDYSDDLKENALVGPFLTFMFEILGHSMGRPLVLDQAGITLERIRSFNLVDAMTESAEYEMEWLMVHLYYNALKHIPGLVKNWWIECKSKQTRMAIESWTEKSFSPLITADTLADVERWSAEQGSRAEDEKELIVKISAKSREVYAGFEIDEMQMQIVVRLPPAYPLEGVKVDGVNRVAVNEKKWQSWLMITQGVITFSNGSITDGLVAFRKNVTGTLKGQTECAICYSMISSDKRMPDKRCQTCKNLFHSSCLFKWFASSNQSTCPLCRNPFNYGTDIASRARRRAGVEGGI